MDLLERLTVLVASNGNVLRSHLDGSLIMRSFLGGHAGKWAGMSLFGMPQAAMALNLNIVKFHFN